MSAHGQKHACTHAKSFAGATRSANACACACAWLSAEQQPTFCFLPGRSGEGTSVNFATETSTSTSSRLGLLFRIPTTFPGSCRGGWVRWVRKAECALCDRGAQACWRWAPGPSWRGALCPFRPTSCTPDFLLENTPPTWKPSCPALRVEAAGTISAPYRLQGRGCLLAALVLAAGHAGPGWSAIHEREAAHEPWEGKMIYKVNFFSPECQS